MISQGWIPLGDVLVYYVVFSTKNGGSAKYLYAEAEGEAIERGSDPRDLTYISKEY
jgi:hypothetical protein